MQNVGQNKIKDITGQRFGKLVAIKMVQKNSNIKSRHAVWLCKCDCGNEAIIDGVRLRNGKTRSCGCYAKERTRERMTTHGMTKTRLFGIWQGMRDRCNNTMSKAYINYGGRGITVCDEWKNDFKAFYDWAFGNGYRDNLTIERINVNGNYCPENCMWIPFEEQSKNRRNVSIYNGLSQRQWALRLNLNPVTLFNHRKRHKVSLEQTVRYYVLTKYV